MPGAIATSHHLATAAGDAALCQGGNAIDAALAAETQTLSARLPSRCCRVTRWRTTLIKVEADGSFSAASDPRSDGSAAIVTGATL